jgi:putative ABC transport system ATP-binding protein
VEVAVPAVVLDRVTKVYLSAGAELAALRDASLAVAAGEAVLVRGPSGSGKTTLLGLAGCLVRPTAGRVRLGDTDVTRLSEEALAHVRRRRVGFVFQGNLLLRGASALDNVMLPALPAAEVDGDLRGRARDLLARFGLEARAAERVERLSGGEQQRVAIARALVLDPPLVLADEPTAHLDAAAGRRFLDLVAALRDEGRTVLVAGHDPALATSGCFDRALTLAGGRFGAREAV